MPSPSASKLYDLRRALQDAVRRSRGLPMQDRYYPPSSPPEGTRMGGEWIMDARTDCEGPGWVPPQYRKPKEVEPSSYTPSGGAVWDD